MLGLALIPPLALAVGLPGAFVITGGAGIAWALYGWVTLPKGKTTASQQQQQQQQARDSQQRQQAAVASAEKQQGSRQAWRLPSGPVLQQMAVLCYAHAGVVLCMLGLVSLLRAIADLLHLCGWLRWYVASTDALQSAAISAYARLPAVV